MKLPEKEYLSFDELAKKWGCSKSDLFHQIVVGNLIPSAYLSGEITAYEIKLCNYTNDKSESALTSELVKKPKGSESSKISIRGILYFSSISIEKNKIVSCDRFARVREVKESDFVYEMDEIKFEFDQLNNEANVPDNIIFVQEEIEHFEREYMQKTSEQISQTSFPWGSHNTKLLTQLSDAAIKFWSLYDPTQVDTAPTNDEVKDWLMTRGVSKTLAEAMATILRADGLRTGRR